jgi:hypothetical protein
MVLPRPGVPLTAAFNPARGGQGARARLAREDEPGREERRERRAGGDAGREERQSRLADHHQQERRGPPHRTPDLVTRVR